MRGFNPFVPCTPVLIRAYRVLRATLILSTIFTVDSAFSARSRPRCVSFGYPCTSFEPSCQESITSSFRTALVYGSGSTQPGSGMKAPAALNWFRCYHIRYRYRVRVPIYRRARAAEPELPSQNFSASRA